MEDYTIKNVPLRVLFITQEDPFYIKVFFEEFLEHSPRKDDILGVVVCPTMGKRSLKALTKQMFDFYGLKDFLRMCGRFLAVRAKGDTLRKVCSRNKIPVYEEKDINSDSFFNAWKGRRVDVIVSVAAPQIFKARLLDLPGQGCINIHHAKLPAYRGMMPNFWQMFHSEKTAGITVHKINPRIDEGDIILQKEIPIKKEYSLDQLIKTTKKLGAHCIMEALDLIREGKVSPFPNEPQKGSYYSFPNAADVREFRKRGKGLL